MPIAQVEELESNEVDVIAATTRSKRGGAQDPINMLLERMDKLIDAKLSATLGGTTTLTIRIDHDGGVAGVRGLSHAGIAEKKVTSLVTVQLRTRETGNLQSSEPCSQG